MPVLCKTLEKDRRFFYQRVRFLNPCTGKYVNWKRRFFQQECIVGCDPGQSISKIIIGDYCQFGSNVVIIARDHAVNDVTRPMRLQDSMPGRTVIGDDCWIGVNVTITRGVSSGRDP